MGSGKGRLSQEIGFYTEGYVESLKCFKQESVHSQQRTGSAEP